MPSPFPGMDPYLESPHYWRDVHQAFLTYARDTLQPRLRPRYRASLTERVYVETSGRSLYPDLTVLKGGGVEARDPVAEYNTATARALPVVVGGEDEPVREPEIEIRSTGDGTVVTVIELLSPTNKSRTSNGREEYLRKQREVQASGANLVEIDLLRAGEHTLAVPTYYLGKARPYDYLVCVIRKPYRDRYELYPFTIAEPMPEVRIPLLPDDPDAALPMQECFTRAYDNGAYRDVLDYSRQPDPPLTPDQWEWAQKLLRTAESQA